MIGKSQGVNFSPFNLESWTMLTREMLRPPPSRLGLRTLPKISHESYKHCIRFELVRKSRAGIVPLTLVSAWHERETKYPPIEKNDYWDPDEYTPDKGLINDYGVLSGLALRLREVMRTASKLSQDPLIG